MKLVNFSLEGLKAGGIPWLPHLGNEGRCRFIAHVPDACADCRIVVMCEETKTIHASRENGGILRLRLPQIVDVPGNVNQVTDVELEERAGWRILSPGEEVTANDELFVPSVRGWVLAATQTCRNRSLSTYRTRTPAPVPVPPRTKRVRLENSDYPARPWLFKFPNGEWCTFDHFTNDGTGIAFGNGFSSHENLMRFGVMRSADCGTTWHPCWKEVAE